MHNFLESTFPMISNSVVAARILAIEYIVLRGDAFSFIIERFAFLVHPHTLQIPCAPCMVQTNLPGTRCELQQLFIAIYLYACCCSPLSTASITFK